MKNLVFIASTAIVLTSCGNNNAELAKLQQQKSLDSMNMALQQQQAKMAQQKTIDSMSALSKTNKSTERVGGHGSYSSGNTQYVQGNAARAEAPAPTKKKKGWSGAAKGAVIGAGVGALSGALIDNKKGRGAIIGGVAGAGIGAGTGAIIDDTKKKKK